MQAVGAPIDDSVFAVDWFRIKLDETTNQAVKTNQQQAVDSFDRFMCGTPVRFDDINESLLNEWVTWLFYKRYSLGTVTTYLGRLSALYGKAVKAGVATDSGCFVSVKKKLKNVSLACMEILSDPDYFNKLRSLVLKDCSKSQTNQLAKDIVLFSLYNGGLIFNEIAEYKKDDYHGINKPVLDIIERYAKPKNKYLFPLKQSGRTPNQLNRAISLFFSDALRMVGINLSDNTVTPIDLWAVLAMRCGFQSTDIAGCIETSGNINPIYSFAVKEVLPPERKAEIFSRVTQILAKDPEDWYAMQFRPRVNYDMISDRMKSVGMEFKQSFYPMEDIIRRVGKKLKCESKPVLPGLLFFKSKATELSEIFFKIGDLAWGYRTTRDIHSPYAVIPQEAIYTYQRAVGLFVDGMDTYPEGSFQMEQGDKVLITGGDFIGLPAVFEKEIRETLKDTKTVKRITYRLRLQGFNNISWVADIDSRLIARISDDKFDSLQDKIIADVKI